MRRKHEAQPGSAEKVVRDIRRATRKHYSAEEKIRIVVEGLRGEDSIAELCRREGINQNLYYRWSKEFLEAGKRRLAGDTAREASSDEVKALRAEARDLKEALAEQMLENRLLKKSVLGRAIPHVSSPPSPRTLFLSSRFSSICSASASFRLRASARNPFTSSLVAARAVSPARRFLPASRNSFDQR